MEPSLARVAHATAKPGRAGDLAAVLLRVAEVLAGFDGCLQYAICRRTDAPDEVWVLERWRDRAAMQASLQLPQARALIPEAMALVADWGTPVDLEPVGGHGE